MRAGRMFAGWVLALGLAAGASAQQMQIQFAEPVELSTAPGTSQFDAYGRRFSLELTSNDRVLAKLSASRKAEMARFQLMRGKLSGQAGSWVRLTEIDGGVEGAIWDGHDLYSVTSYQRIARFLTTPLAVSPRQTVVFRLSDTLNALPAQYCATTSSHDGLAKNNGLVQYRKLVAELGDRTMSAITMTRQMEISLISDGAFQTLYGLNSVPEMMARFNVAEGIFGEQAGLLILANDVRVAPTPEPFVSTNASTLIEQLSTYRRNTPAVGTADIAHLVTGKSLDGDTVGIAILGGACNLDQGVSLSEAGFFSSMSGLIMAHELAHNLGAEHDGVAGGACPNVPQNLLMAPALSGSSVLSQCSLDSMRALIQNGACLAPASYAHVELSPAVPVPTVELDNPVTLTYVIRSSGTLAAQSVRLDVDPYGTIPAISATTTQGTCTVVAGNVGCDLGAIPAGAQRTVEVTLLPNAIGQYNVEAVVSASNNQNTRDGSQTQAVSVIQNVDGEVLLSATPVNVLAGDTIDFLVTVRSLRSRPLLNARVSLYTGAMLFDSVTGAATCTFATGQASAVCAVGDIPGGQQRQFTVRATTANKADPAVNAQLFTDNDSFSDENNRAFTRVHIASRRDVGLQEVSPNMIAAPDAAFEFTANVRSTGAQSIDNVTFSMLVQTPLSTSEGIDSVTIGGVICAPAPRNNYQCSLGTMTAGEVRPVVIRGRGAGLGTYGFLMSVSAPQQDDGSNNDLHRGVTITHPVDLAVFSGSPMSGTESLEFTGNATVVSQGSQAVAAGQITVVLPPQVRFNRFFIDSGTCTIPDPQHLQCTAPFPSTSTRASLSWFAVSSVPGSYTATVTATAANDGDAANDVRLIPINVAAIVDVGVEAFTAPAFLLTGRDYNVPFTVIVGSSAVNAATAYVMAASGAQVRSVTTPTGSCTREDSQRLTCNLGTLAAGTRLELIATVSSQTPIGFSGLSIRVEATGDNNQSNNIKSTSFRTIDAGDMQVTVDASSITATSGSSFHYPTINVRHTGPMANPRIELTLPAALTLTAVRSVIGACSGTTVITCGLPSDWPEDQPLQINFDFSSTVTGSFTSTVRVLSGNDTNAANDQATVAITVNVAPPPPPPPPPPPAASGSSSGGGASSGGGGGGSIEWLLLGLLGLVTARRGITVLRRASVA